MKCSDNVREGESLRRWPIGFFMEWMGRKGGYDGGLVWRIVLFF